LAAVEDDPEHDYVDAAKLREELDYVEYKRSELRKGNVIRGVNPEIAPNDLSRCSFIQLWNSWRLAMLQHPTCDMLLNMGDDFNNPPFIYALRAYARSGGVVESHAVTNVPCFCLT
jgi:hypothetical protein